MLAILITGNQLRAGRALADLSMEDLAARARRPRQGQRGALRCASKVIANGA
jgi:hypothetical protein